MKENAMKSIANISSKILLSSVNFRIHKLNNLSRSLCADEGNTRHKYNINIYQNVMKSLC